ncbi:hypothetical protein HK098_000299 [Nowakowskiella sp. JEL0407]|nr:hypothetical protein HK098_000299 [Nowakowskiella sp. JEL0407]
MSQTVNSIGQPPELPPKDLPLRDSLLEIIQFSPVDLNLSVDLPEGFQKRYTSLDLYHTTPRNYKASNYSKQISSDELNNSNVRRRKSLLDYFQRSRPLSFGDDSEISEQQKPVQRKKSFIDYFQTSIASNNSSETAADSESTVSKRKSLRRLFQSTSTRTSFVESEGTTAEEDIIRPKEVKRKKSLLEIFQAATNADPVKQSEPVKSNFSEDKEKLQRRRSLVAVFQSISSRVRSQSRSRSRTRTRSRSRSPGRHLRSQSQVSIIHRLGISQNSNKSESDLNSNRTRTPSPPPDNLKVRNSRFMENKELPPKPPTVADKNESDKESPQPPLSASSSLRRQNSYHKHQRKISNARKSERESPSITSVPIPESRGDDYDAESLMSLETNSDMQSKKTITNTTALVQKSTEVSHANPGLVRSVPLRSSIEDTRNRKVPQQPIIKTVTESITSIDSTNDESKSIETRNTNDIDSKLKAVVRGDKSVNGSVNEFDAKEEAMEKWNKRGSVFVVERTTAASDRSLHDLENDEKANDINWSKVFQGVWSTTSTSATVAALAARKAAAAAAESQTLNYALKVTTDAASKSQTINSAIKAAQAAQQAAANSETLNSALKAAKAAKDAAANSETLNSALKAAKATAQAAANSQTLNSALKTTVSAYRTLASKVGSEAEASSSTIPARPRKNSLAPIWTGNFETEQTLSPPPLPQPDKPNEDHKKSVSHPITESIQEEKILENTEKTASPEPEQTETKQKPMPVPPLKINTAKTEKLPSAGLEVLQELLHTPTTPTRTFEASRSVESNQTMKIENKHLKNASSLIPKKLSVRRQRMVSKLDRLLSDIEVEMDRPVTPENTIPQQQSGGGSDASNFMIPEKYNGTLSKAKSKLVTRTVVDEHGDVYKEEIIVDDMVIEHWESHEGEEHEHVSEGGKLGKWQERSLPAPPHQLNSHRNSLTNSDVRSSAVSEQEHNSTLSHSLDEGESTDSAGTNKKPGVRRVVSHVRRVFKLRKKQASSTDTIAEEKEKPRTIMGFTLGRNASAASSASSPHEQPAILVDRNSSVSSGLSHESGVEIEVEVFAKPYAEDEFDSESIKIGTPKHFIDHSLDYIEDEVDDDESLYSNVERSAYDGSDDGSSVKEDLVDRGVFQIKGPPIPSLSVYDNFDATLNRNRSRAKSGDLPRPYLDIGSPMKAAEIDDEDDHPHKKEGKGRWEGLSKIMKGMKMGL